MSEWLRVRNPVLSLLLASVPSSLQMTRESLAVLCMVLIWPESEGDGEDEGDGEGKGQV